MERFINCIAHKSSEGKLLIGSEYTALFDCGMLFCAEKTIANVKAALGERPLDYIFLTHTHYDHLGALPLFREQWQDVRVLTSEIGSAVMLKDTPRRVFRELSLEASKSLGGSLEAVEYDDDAFHADIIIKDGDVTDIGGLTAQTIETPGHTRDSLSFFIPELRLLILSETTGIMLKDGSVRPCYLTSCRDTIESIEKCKSFGYEHISLPHNGIISGAAATSFFEKSKIAVDAYRDLIFELNDKDPDENKIVEALCNAYCDDEVLSIQPKESFLLNARAAVTSTLRER